MVASKSRRGIPPGVPVRITETILDIVHPLVGGNVATDGVQYSSVATVGTTAVEVLSQLIDYGVDLKNKYLYTELTQKFTNLLAAGAGTLLYYWEARQENQGTTRDYTGLIATLSKNIPTLGVTGDAVEDTFKGFLDLATFPESPIRLRLMAKAFRAANIEAKVKNTSLIEVCGIVIPGV